MPSGGRVPPSEKQTESDGVKDDCENRVVSAATYAIDKPYSYKIPEGMTLQPGQRVQLPFGCANKRTEGVVLTVGDGQRGKAESRGAVPGRSADSVGSISCGWRRFCGSGISAPSTSASGSCPGGTVVSGAGTDLLTADRSGRKTIRKDGAAEVLAPLKT